MEAATSKSTSTKYISFHPEILTKLDKIQSSSKLRQSNLVFFGPNAVGKRTLAVRYICAYHKTNGLACKKTILVKLSKRDFPLKISKLHIELDPSNILNNCRQNWDKVFETIKDITLSSPTHQKFIILHNVEKTNQDILNCLYAYMQNLEPNIRLQFIILTSSLISLPFSITQRCQCIRVKRPSRNKIINQLGNSLDYKAHSDRLETLYNYPFGVKENDPAFICLIDMVMNKATKFNDADIMDLRNHLYHLQIDKCGCQELPREITKALAPHISPDTKSELGKHLGSIVQGLAYAYRPIYHLENLVLYLSSQIHEE